MEIGKSVESLFNALGRLIEGKPINVPLGTMVSNDAVAMEAGFKRGYIKKGRPHFTKLIQAIEEAKAASKQNEKPKENVKSLRSQIRSLQDKIDEGLNREISLIYELINLKRDLNKLTGSNVFPIGSKSPTKSSL